MLSTLRCGSEDSTNDARKTAILLLNVHVPDNREDHDTTERAIRKESRNLSSTEIAIPAQNGEVLAALRQWTAATGPYLIEVVTLKVASKVILDQMVRFFEVYLRWGVLLPGMLAPSKSS